ncbi:MAG TPA: M20/M25/M40 family metallo-hydrolase [Pyrinomonadaceae bacterium]
MTTRVRACYLVARSRRFVFVRSCRLVLVCLLLLCPAARAQQQPISAQTQADLSRLTGEVLVNGEAYSNLEYLSDRIGARVTGSEGERRALEWTLARFKEYGYADAHHEPVAVPHRWTRGPAEAALVAPVARRVDVTSYGWAVGTDGEVTAPVVPLDEISAAQFAAKAERLRGAFVNFTLASKVDYHFMAEAVRLALRHGARAILMPAFKPDKLNNTGDLLWGEIVRLPIVSIAREDAALVERLQASGEEVRLRLNVQNRVGDGFTTANVVAELRGAEAPDEIVLVGGHLDSWDLGTGATDNGTGAMAVLEAARALVKLGVRPRRTIRFALFTGEEQALYGSRAYVAAHAKELDKHVCVLIMDHGHGLVRGWELPGRTDLVAPMREVIAPLASLNVTELVQKPSVDTDHAFFVLQGVPGLVMSQDPKDYRTIHHAASDTFDKVDKRELLTDAAALAATALVIANRATRLAPRQTPAEIRRLAEETGMDKELRPFGLYPFADR